ncbi:MAG: 30S ribosomal protein S6 [Syntrophales bacterium]
MKRYETIYIVNIDVPGDEVTGLIEDYSAIITERKGVIVKIEKWGQRKLAYKIEKQAKGYYIFVDFMGVGAIVTELERKLKIDDRILKFMTIKTKDKVDLKEIEDEIAAAGKEVKEKEVSSSSDVKTAEEATDKPGEEVTEAKISEEGEDPALSSATEKKEDRSE